MPDRELVLEHLRLAEKHVDEGSRHLTNQLELVAQLERKGCDAREARRLLCTFEDLQAAHTADLERLRRELADLDIKSN